MNREQRTSTGQSGTKHDRRRLLAVAFALTVASPVGQQSREDEND